MARRLFDKLGNYLFLFFVLQIQFAIKGSKALPGNSQRKNGQECGSDGTIITAVSNDLDLANIREETTATLTNDNQSEEEEEIYTDDNRGEAREIELIVPKVRNRSVLGIDTSQPVETRKSPDSFDPESLDYSMLKSAYPLRPKSISRQSLGSGDHTPGLDRDWVEIDSEFSGSSRLARIIYSTHTLVNDAEIKPMTFDDLCEFLELTAEREICEDELILLCKRIIKNPENMIKALKDLPLFIQNCDFNQNAIKINSILYSYLGHSGECFKDLITVENMENGSGSSRCSSRGTDSSIESEGLDLEDMERIDFQNLPKTDTIDDMAPSSSPKIIEESTPLRVLEEINSAQARVPHIPQPMFPGHFINERLVYMPTGSYNRFGIQAMKARSFLYTLNEETKVRTVSEDESSSTVIEEID